MGVQWGEEWHMPDTPDKEQLERHARYYRDRVTTRSIEIEWEGGIQHIPAGLNVKQLIKALEIVLKPPYQIEDCR